MKEQTADCLNWDNLPIRQEERYAVCSTDAYVSCISLLGKTAFTSMKPGDILYSMIPRWPKLFCFVGVAVMVLSTLTYAVLLNSGLYPFGIFSIFLCLFPTVFICTGQYSAGLWLLFNLVQRSDVYHA